MFYFIKIDAIEYNLLNIHVLIVFSFEEMLFLLFLVHALMIFLLLMSQFFFLFTQYIITDFTKFIYILFEIMDHSISAMFCHVIIAVCSIWEK